MSPLIRCRAKVVDTCFDGLPEKPEYEDGQADDGTWDGDSVVCNACYLAVQPLTLSGHALLHELPDAIWHYRTTVEYLQQHENPVELVKEAQGQIGLARPGSPYHRSATYMKQLAESEVARRAIA